MDFDEVDSSEVDYRLPSMANAFGYNINSSPLQSAVDGTRLFYAARFVNQAVPLVNGEAPLVQNAVPGGEGMSFDTILGQKLGAIMADDDGVVESVDNTGIVLRNRAGEQRRIPLQRYLPMNRKTYLAQQPVVKPGDVVSKGSPMARSNFTDAAGQSAMGMNAFIGIVPYLGRSMDDATVISRSFANRLTSQHGYIYNMDKTGGAKLGKNHFSAIFPKSYSKELLDKLDDDGVIQIGQTVQQGDPLVLATSPRNLSGADALGGKVTSVLRAARRNTTQIYDHGSPGVVEDVVKTKKGVKVFVRSESPSEKGDKLVFRSGQKGVISEVVADEDMPRTADGRVFDMLLNPQSLNSRKNDQLPYEMLLGKLAEATGQKEVHPGFSPDGGSWFELVKNKLEEAGLSDKETVFDPKFNKTLAKPITTGVGYVLKLHHQAAGKHSYRGQGGYDLDALPLKGSGDAAQAKRYSGLETSAGLAAGIYNILRDKAILTGTRNPEYWKDFRSGYTPRAPEAPFAYDKLKALLGGAGIMVRNMKNAEGRKVERIGPMSAAEIRTKNPVKVKNADLVEFTETGARGKQGGLFDPSLVSANRWGEIDLPIPIVNPAFEENARTLLGLTKKDYDAVMRGDREI